MGRLAQTLGLMSHAIQTLSGSCLCGAVSYEVTAPFLRFVYCHCSRCRKSTGSAFASNLYCSPTRFRWTKGEHCISRYDLPSARSFAVVVCNTCNSPLPRLTRGGNEVVVPAGSLDTESSTRPEAHIFWKSKAIWFSDNDALPTYSELPEWWLERRDLRK